MSGRPEVRSLLWLLYRPDVLGLELLVFLDAKIALWDFCSGYESGIGIASAVGSFASA